MSRIRIVGVSCTADANASIRACVCLLCKLTFVVLHPREFGCVGVTADCIEFLRLNKIQCAHVCYIYMYIVCALDDFML